MRDWERDYIAAECTRREHLRVIHVTKDGLTFTRCVCGVSTNEEARRKAAGLGG